MGMSASQVFNSDGAGNDTNKLDRNRALALQKRRRFRRTASSSQHWVEQNNAGLDQTNR